MESAYDRLMIGLWSAYGVFHVITIDKQFYCCTKEVIKSSRVTHFKTNFYWIYLAWFFY